MQFRIRGLDTPDLENSCSGIWQSRFIYFSTKAMPCNGDKAPAQWSTCQAGSFAWLAP